MGAVGAVGGGLGSSEGTEKDDSPYSAYSFGSSSSSSGGTGTGGNSGRGGAGGGRGGEGGEGGGGNDDVRRAHVGGMLLTEMVCALLAKLLNGAMAALVIDGTKRISTNGTLPRNRFNRRMRVSHEVEREAEDEVTRLGEEEGRGESTLCAVRCALYTNNSLYLSFFLSSHA